MANYTKILHISVSIIAALTVGVLLSLFIGVVSLVDSFFKFPVQVYRNLQQQEKLRRLSQVFTPTPDQENIWDKHIRRMEEKNKHNSNHE
jgi:hypothetical protein|tara:strand:+ start:292 stop:561 length:270 start_codon:yes stop_codon:yes gene_type:complete